jgi:hypothetical protein
MDAIALARYETLAVVNDPRERERHGWLQAVMRDVEAAPLTVPALKAAVAAQPGRISFGALKRIYYAWKREGDAALCDRRRLPQPGRENPWLEVYQTYCERHNRNNKGSWRAMMDDFWAGRVMEHGVGDWRDCWRRERRFQSVPEHLPPGWVPKQAAYQTLQRAAKANPHYQFQLAASRRGRRAAHEFVLPVLRTRVGLEPGQVYEYDDVHIDVEVVMPGLGKVARPQMFIGYDVSSGMDTCQACRPQFPEEGTDRRNSLKEREFRMLFAWQMTGVGFHPGGCRNVVEHGTTAIRERLRERIKRIPLYGGLIDFETSGILAEAVHAGFFKGDGGGNFRLKAYCEGAHRLAHAARAMLPGQVGQDAAHRPESHAALVRYDERLMTAVAALPPDVRDRVRFNLLDFDSFTRLNSLLLDRLADDPDHRLEGWDGRMVTVWRLSESDAWRPLAELDRLGDDERLAVMAYLSAHPEHRGVRRQTRREAWLSGCAKLIRVPISELPMLLEDADSRRVTVRKDGTFGFRDQFYYGPDEIIYHAVCRGRAGFQHALVPGREYVFWGTPYHQEGGVVCDPESGKVVGLAPAYKRAPYYDLDAIHAAAGAQNHDLAVKMLPVRGRHQREAEARMELLGHNADVLRAAMAAGFSNGAPGAAVPALAAGAESHDLPNAVDRAAAEYDDGVPVEL